MAGLKALQKTYKEAERMLQLNDPSGYFPLYLVKDKEGNTDVVPGTFEQIQDTDIVSGKVFTRDATRSECLSSATPIAPDCPKGATVVPIQLSIRNPESPDAERFRKARGVDMDAILKDAKKQVNAQKISQKEEEIETVCGLSVAEIKEISAAACIGGFVNVPSDTEDGALMPYSEENALQFVKDIEIAKEQIKEFVSDLKKFASPLPTGKSC